MTVVELNNDLVTIGEHAATAFSRSTRRLKEHIEPMARGLAEAKRRYPKTTDFSAWLKTSPYGEIGKDDRAALIKLGKNWNDDLAARFALLDSYSPELIADALFRSDDPKEEDDGDSGLYGSERIARTNEAWDTIDSRLVKSLAQAVPALKERMVWEPCAGRGLMVDQLEEAGIRVYGATDIEPRRDDIYRLDLLETRAILAGCNAIVTNPPWGKLAAPVVRHALSLAEQSGALVCMLLPLPWIAGRKIADLTGSTGFDALIVPRYRARWMTPEEEAELEDGPSAPKMNHVWLVWNFARNPDLAPRIDFVDAPADDATEDDEEDA
jgi:hypothetical protein